MKMHLAKRKWQSREAARHFLCVAGIGLVLGFFGPFGSYPALDIATRYAFWLFLAAFGYLSALLVSHLLVSARPGTASVPARVAVTTFVSAVPTMFATAWALSLVQPGRVVGLTDVPALYLAVASVQFVHSLILIAAISTPLRAAQTDHAPASPAENGASEARTAPLARSPAFMHRMPAHLRHEVIALEAEDHYVRVHTALGSSLVLMRLSDAIAELSEAEGMRVHRSWWVAHRAIRETVRTGSKGHLVLTNDLQVPVSRKLRHRLRAVL